MKENRTVKGFRKELGLEFGKDEVESIMASFYLRYRELLDENPGETPELQEHSVDRIYPTIAMADALQKSGMTREESVSWLHDLWERSAEKEAQSMRMMLKIPFSYRLVPGMFLSVQERNFGDKAGFVSKVISNERSHTVFHMLKCPYNDIFRRYGYPELVDCFCHQDDVKNERMHSRLEWKRENTLGSGGDHCDFSMEIIDKH